MTVLALLQTVGVYRYRLLWARVRDTRYRAAFLTGGAVWGLLAVYLAMTAFAAAEAALLVRRTLDLVTIVLTTVSVAAVTSTVTLGAGTRRAFSDRLLRRFPLTPRVRLVVVHVSGLMEPFWLATAVVVLTFAVGLVLVGAARPGFAAASAALFFLCTYATAIVAGALADRVLASPRAGAALTALVLLAFVTLPHVARRYPQSLTAAAAAGRVLPAGIAARLMVSGSAADGAWQGFALLAWCGLLAQLAAVLAAAERRPAHSRGALTASPALDGLGRRIRGPAGPIAMKVLRYHLRSLRVRLSLALAPVAIGMAASGAGRAHQRFFVALAMFFMAGVLGNTAFVFNAFAFDGRGIVRYRRWPVPFVTVLRAAAGVSLACGLLSVALSLAVLTIAAPDLGPLALWTLAGAGVAGTAILHAAGMLTGVLFPRASAYDSVRGNQLPYQTTLVMFAALAVVFFAAAFLSQWDALAGTWRLAAGVWSVAALGAVIYAVVWTRGLHWAERLGPRCVNLIAAESGS